VIINRIWQVSSNLICGQFVDVIFICYCHS